MSLLENFLKIKLIFCLVYLGQAQIHRYGNFIVLIMLEKIKAKMIKLQAIVEAVQTGNLFELLNFGPISQNGVPGISDQELDHTIQGLLKDVDPQVPVLGSAKPLLVDHRILGVLSGKIQD